MFMSFVGEETLAMPEGVTQYAVGLLDEAVVSARDALASVWRWMESSAPKALAWGLEHSVRLAVLVASATLVLSAVRWLLTRRALSRRVRYAMLPTETFDPSPEEIVRSTSQLSRARRSLGPFGPRRCDAVRLKLVSAPGGRMLQLIEGPARAESVLRIGGFPEVELRPLETLDVESLDGLHLVASAVEDDDEPTGTASGGPGDGRGEPDRDLDDPVLVPGADVEGWGD